jgi:hypothetical protein
MHTPATRLDRRRALRLVAGGLLAVPAGLRLATPASAGRTWCRVDPDVVLEGTVVRVVVAVPEEYLPLVCGPTKLWLNLPSQVDRQFAWADDGFNGLGYDVGFSTAYQPDKPCAKFSVNLTVKVPIVDGTKVPIWCGATPDRGTAVERTGNDAKTGTSLNFTVYGSL